MYDISLRLREAIRLARQNEDVWPDHIAARLREEGEDVGLFWMLV